MNSSDECEVMIETLTLDGVELEAKWCLGDQTQPTIILLHEGLGCVDMWRDFPELLCAATGCSVLVYSRQGYGRSSAVDVPRPLTYMHHEGLNVLPKLVGALNIKSHVLIGHSDGGSISLIYAGGTLASGLKGVVTMAPHVFNEPLTTRSIEESSAAFTEKGLRSRLKKYHGANVDCAFWGWNKAWLHPDFQGWNIEEYLPNIGVPHLALQGYDDPYGTVAQIDAIVEGSPKKVDVVMLEACGHSPYKEQASASLDAISKFLAVV